MISFFSKDFSDISDHLRISPFKKRITGDGLISSSLLLHSSIKRESESIDTPTSVVKPGDRMIFIEFESLQLIIRKVHNSNNNIFM